MSKRWGIILILLLGSWLRLSGLYGMPPGLYHDEAYNGLDALSLVEGKEFPIHYEGWELYAQDAHAERAAVATRWPIFFEGNYGREPLHIYLMGVMVSVMGNEPLAIRLVPAFAGIVGIAAIVAVAKQLYRKRAWVIVGAAMGGAFLYPAVHFSRFGLRVMLFLPLQCFVIAFFWRGLQRKKRLYFWGSGAWLGLSFYSYASARMLPLVVGGWMIYWLWRYEQDRRLYGTLFAQLVGVSITVAAPLLHFFYQYPYYFIFRSQYVALHGGGVIAGRPWLTRVYNIGRVLWGLVGKGEEHLRHNLPGRPFLDLLQSGLFLLGMIGKKGEKELFLLFWGSVMLLPSILSSDAPHFGRMSGVIPPLAIGIGLGFARLGDWIKQFGFNERRGSVLLFGLLGGISFGWTTFDYFVTYRAEPLLTEDFYLSDWVLGEAIEQMGADGAIVYLTETKEQMGTIYFALGGKEDWFRTYQSGGAAVPLGDEGGEVVYLVREGNERLSDQLGRWYERVERGAVIEGWIPIKIRESVQFVAEPLLIGDGLALADWELVVDGARVEVGVVWERVEEGTAVGYTAYIHLLDKDGEIIAQIDRAPEGYPTADWQVGERVADHFSFVGITEEVRQIRVGYYQLILPDQYRAVGSIELDISHPK